MPESDLAAPLHGCLALLTRLLPMKTGVVHVEAALESRGKAIFRIEDDAANEGPCAITLVMENFRKKRNARRQAVAKVADAVVLRVGTAKDGGMRDRRDGRLRIGTLEDHTLACQRVQMRR